MAVDFLQREGGVERAEKSLGIALRLPTEHVADGLCGNLPERTSSRRCHRTAASGGPCQWRRRVAHFLGEEAEGGKVFDRLARAPGVGGYVPSAGGNISQSITNIANLREGKEGGGAC